MAFIKCPHCGFHNRPGPSACAKCGKEVTGIAPTTERGEPRGSGAIGFLVILSLLAGAAGLLALSNATAGVGLVGLGCLLAILARMAQASSQHNHLVSALRADVAIAASADPAGERGL